MALLSCPDCEHYISIRALTCPSCGRRFEPARLATEHESACEAELVTLYNRRLNSTDWVICTNCQELKWWQYKTCPNCRQTYSDSELENIHNEKINRKIQIETENKCRYRLK